MNYQENYLIQQIDLSRQGITPEIASETHFDLMQYHSFYNRAIDVSFRIAEKGCGQTDRQLLWKISGIAIRIALEKRGLRRVLAENGLDMQMSQSLPPKDPLRVNIDSRAAMIRELRKTQDETKECLRSRQFLRDQPDLIAQYLDARGIGRSRLPKVIRWLHVHYPE